MGRMTMQGLSGLPISDERKMRMIEDAEKMSKKKLKSRMLPEYGFITSTKPNNKQTPSEAE